MTALYLALPLIVVGALVWSAWRPEPIWIRVAYRDTTIPDLFGDLEWEGRS